MYPGQKSVLNYFWIIFILLWIIFIIHSSDASKCHHEYERTKTSTGDFRGPSDSELSRDNNISCTYIFRGDINDRIKITFDTFNLVNKSIGGCNLMYIDVFQIDHRGTMELQKRLCGSIIPDPIISVYRTVQLVFKMRPQAAQIMYRKPKAGEQMYGRFGGTYEFVDEIWQPFPQSSPECGGLMVTGVGGVLTSPGYPQPYKSNLECTWMIKVLNYQTIDIKYLQIDLGDSFHCSLTQKPYISMWNGFASPEKDEDEIKCGKIYFYDRPHHEFQSSTYRLVIRFESGMNIRNSSGFKLVWTAISIPKVDYELYDPSQCKSFLCDGGESCIAEGFICSQLPRYCIDESLRCNGYTNCAKSDESDEHGCWTAVIASASTIGGLLLLILFTVTFITFCKKRRLRRQLRRGNMDRVHYDPNDKIQGEYIKDSSTANGKKISVSYSPVRKLSSPGYIAVYSPDKKGYSVYDEYDSETCWSHKDKAHYKDLDRTGETYINHSAQHFNHYENRESISREIQRKSPTAQRSPKKRIIQNSPSGSLVQIKKSHYIACPTLPTPPESDPEIDPAYSGQTYMVVKDRIAMTQKNPAYSTMPRVNSKSVSAVV